MPNFPPLVLGLNSIDTVPSPGDVAGASSLRAKALRIWANWATLEPLPGQWQWTPLDQVITATRAAGLDPWLMVGGSPAHACRRPAGPPAEPDSLCPPQLDPWVDFLANLAYRYRGQVRYYEIWNEPDDPYYWTTGPSAAEYADLLHVSHTAAKAGDPTAQVVMAATAGSNLPFTDAVLRILAGEQVFDAAAVHPYHWSDATGFLTENPDLPHLIDLPGGKTVQMNFKNALLRHQQVFEDNGYDAPDLWITELGWPANGYDRPAYVSLQQQADYLRCAHALATTDPALVPFVRGLFWYANRDWAVVPGDVDDPLAQREFGFFGLAFQDGVQKPAAAAFRDLGV